MADVSRANSTGASANRSARPGVNSIEPRTDAVQQKPRADALRLDASVPRPFPPRLRPRPFALRPHPLEPRLQAVAPRPRHPALKIQVAVRRPRAVRPRLYRVRPRLHCVRSRLDPFRPKLQATEPRTSRRLRGSTAWSQRVDAFAPRTTRRVRGSTAWPRGERRCDPGWIASVPGLSAHSRKNGQIAGFVRDSRWGLLKGVSQVPESSCDNG